MQIRDFEDYVEKANAATNEAALFDIFLQAVNNHGLDRALFCLATDHTDIDASAGIGVLRNYPGDWMSYYFENGYDKIDPVMIYGLSQMSAYSWDDIPKRMKLKSKQVKCLNYGKEAGLNSGVCTPLRGPNNQLAGMSLASSAAIDGFDGKIDIINAYCNHFYIAFKRLKSKIPPKEEVPNFVLSPTQREVLLWICKGKTDNEIGMIMGISYDAVRFHIKNIFEIFGVNNRMLAVVVAITKGLIHT